MSVFTEFTVHHLDWATGRKLIAVRATSPVLSRFVHGLASILLAVSTASHGETKTPVCVGA